MPTHWIDKPDETIRKIIAATFPSYRGKKIKLSTDVPSRLDSYWDGGSRDYFGFYQLSTGTTYDVDSNHPFFESNRPRHLEKLPPGIVLVKHSIFCGKDMGITIYANNDDLTPMLPPKVELTPHEKIVLEYTRSYKASYAGVSNYRFVEAKRSTGIKLDEWEAAKALLIEKKLLNKRGAITPAGRNAIG
ncbi:MAG: hypothetical protein ACWGQW_01560 [bacterium]